MGRSLTVLDWADIQVLVQICSHSVPKDEENFTEQNAVRHRLVESFLRFFQSWQPGAEMDDELRKPLISALEEFANTVGARKKRPLFSLEKEKLSNPQIYSECVRIAKLLRSALSGSEDGDQGGGSSVSNLLGLILVYVAQGQLITSYWRLLSPPRRAFA